MYKKLVPLALTLACTFPAFAQQEAAVKTQVENKLQGPVTSVTKTGYSNLYEVYLRDQNQIFYTDAKASFFLVGNLIKPDTQENVTQARLTKLSAIPFKQLPLNQAIKQVRGNGSRVLASFEDPNCGYCKRLAQELEKLDNVTIYTFLYPVLSDDSTQKSRQIWCSANPAQTWSDWMLRGKVPAGKDDCDTSAIAKNLEFGAQHGIRGTPTLVFADGQRVPGAIPLAQIEQKLKEVHKK